jgi:hypothetical protein
MRKVLPTFNMVASSVLPSLHSVLSTVPALKLRKDIWTQFPVCLIKLPYSADGRDRYAIQWHQKNLDMWCQKIPHYENVVRVRLMHALMNTTDRWTVEPPKQVGDICIIAMLFSEDTREFHTLPDLRAESIDLKTVDTIKQYFPVCWKSRKNRHTLEFHNTFVRALAQKYCLDELEIRQLTLDRLLPALKAAEWTVELPTKSTTSEICTISKFTY